MNRIQIDLQEHFILVCSR